jgi:hypothetical protein
MKLIDLTPGTKIRVDGHVRTVERVSMHPAGPMVSVEGSPWMRHHYSYEALVRDGAEVVR